MASLTLRDIPDDLYRRLAEAANENDRSLNREIIARLKDSMDPEPMTIEEFLRLAEEISSSATRELTAEEADEIFRKSKEDRR
jgi:hypothetical protein